MSSSAAEKTQPTSLGLPSAAAKVTVLEELLEWSQERPGWQRDALRRLLLNAELSDSDLIELAEICKCEHGLSDDQTVSPLQKKHIPDKTAGGIPVSLDSIFHLRGVNALAEDQTLKFGPRLTVVYGDNGSGKTGYTRILKGACRARGQEQILGNVASGSAPLSPSVAIKYRSGSEVDTREWAGNEKDGSISRVSVFDTQSAAVYLREKTDVAFRPFGLDLFDKLAKACKSIRARLESEQKSLNSKSLADLLALFPQGTAAFKLLASISSLTKPESVQVLCRMTAAEEARLAFLEKSIVDLQSNNPEQQARQLSLVAGRVQALAKHLKAVELALSQTQLLAALDMKSELQRKAIEAKSLREGTFTTGTLAGTGSESWIALWESARRFSQEKAYPGQAFPVLEDDTECVLCQQKIDHAAAHRLTGFEEFVVSTTERELRQKGEAFTRIKKGFSELTIKTEASEATLNELRIEHEPLAEAVGGAFANNEARCEALIGALAEMENSAIDIPPLIAVSIDVDTLAAQLEARIGILKTDSAADALNGLLIEAQELRSRKLLSIHEPRVLGEIESKKKYAAYGLCIDDTKTNAITQKGSAVTRASVSETLKNAFRDELEKLAFRHIEVELREAGGADGVLYHKLVLSRAPGVELPKVVSEGEQRCLSIAAFFAELSTADDPSGIVFDDPVSSLDFRWREGVARRLVQEAKCRQVIVFTHDVVFLLLLKQIAEALGVEQADQHLRKLSAGSGVCSHELPWVALPIKKKIGHLKNEWQTADKLFREGHQAAYEKDAKYLYGLLREAWERALEEVLLAGIVERFRPGIQTQHIDIIADISKEDCQAIDLAMTKTSKWLAGHDQAAAARAPVPEPSELKADIEALDAWVSAIRKRRN